MTYHSANPLVSDRVGVLPEALSWWEPAAAEAKLEGSVVGMAMGSKCGSEWRPWLEQRARESARFGRWAACYNDCCPT